MQITFKKTGRAIKEAIQRKIHLLQTRLEADNQCFQEFLRDTRKVRAYIVHESVQGLSSSEATSVPEVLSKQEAEEIRQRARRIYKLEQELYKLRLVKDHLDDDELFDLEYTDLLSYGFECDEMKYQ